MMDIGFYRGIIWWIVLESCIGPMSFGLTRNNDCSSHGQEGRTEISGAGGRQNKSFRALNAPKKCLFLCRRPQSKYNV